MPWLRSSHNVAGALFGNWSLSGLLLVQSGNPFSILAFNGCENFFSSSSLNQTSAQEQGSLTQPPCIANPVGQYTADSTGSVSQIQNSFHFNASGFTTNATFYDPPTGVGDLPIRGFHGPVASSLDLSLQKRFRFGERRSLQLRLEGVNILNHTSLFIPDQYPDGNPQCNEPSIGSQCVVPFIEPRRLQILAMFSF
jgi:hypothetical protein